MKKFFLNEKMMLGVVLLNVAIIFLQECEIENGVFSAIDIVCSLIFVLETLLSTKNQ